MYDDSETCSTASFEMDEVITIDGWSERVKFPVDEKLEEFFNFGKQRDPSEWDLLQFLEQREKENRADEMVRKMSFLKRLNINHEEITEEHGSILNLRTKEGNSPVNKKEE